VTLTPPNRPQITVQYWNTSNTVGGKIVPVAHCHIVGEPLYNCGLEVSAFQHREPVLTAPLCDVCQFVVDAINRGAAVSWKV